MIRSVILTTALCQLFIACSPKGQTTKSSRSSSIPEQQAPAADGPSQGPVSEGAGTAGVGGESGGGEQKAAPKRVLARNVVWGSSSAALTDDEVDPNLRVLASNVVFESTDASELQSTNVQDALVEATLDASQLLAPGTQWSRESLMDQAIDRPLIKIESQNSVTLPAEGYGLTGDQSLDATGTLKVVEGVLILKTKGLEFHAYWVERGVSTEQQRYDFMKADYLTQLCGPEQLCQPEGFDEYYASQQPYLEPLLVEGEITKVYTVLKRTTEKLVVQSGNEVEVWTRQK